MHIFYFFLNKTGSVKNKNLGLLMSDQIGYYNCKHCCDSEHKFTKTFWIIYDHSFNLKGPKGDF